MVYSSDFYTSRRPAYYKPASSYSVTPLYSSDGYDLPPTYYKAHQVYQTSTTPTPFILTPSISTGKPSSKVLPYNGYPYNHHHYVPLHRRSAATIHGVLDRIEHRPRSHPSYDATDEYLNSRSSTNFDDVTRDIRAQTAGLLKQVYTPTIRPKISSVSNGYSELPIAQRIESDAYIEKILSDSDSYRRDNSIGKGHLACVSYAGGKAYPRRRPHLSKEVDDNITMLSYYNKTREAVAASSTNPTVKVNNTETPKYYPKKKLEDESKNNFNKIESTQIISNKNLAAEKEATRLASEKEAAEKEAAQLHAEEEAAKKEASKLAAKEAARLASEQEAAEQEATRILAEEKAAEKEAARLAAEEEAARLAAEEEAARLAAEEEAARLAAEEEAARLAAEEEVARLEAEEKAARLAAEEEATRLAAEEEATRLAAEEEATRLAAEEEAARRSAAEEDAARSALDKKVEETEETEQVVNEFTTEEEIDQSEQQIELSEKTRDISSESQETNAAAIAKSSTTTTSTEIINEDEGGVKTTAVFQRTIKKTTTITSSTSVVSENDGDISSNVEIQEIVEENGDIGEDEHDTENIDVAQAEGQESSEEEDESEEEEESEEE
ncbi:plectin-like [Metopolophium dirhodum]|uniref:plectin-like n=1 Tax=Metopolophium dirhodum TaxID=44670 RepID=UPI00298FDEBB|nr:plectin-like [Metopolophium dirhodum]